MVLVVPMNGGSIQSRRCDYRVRKDNIAAAITTATIAQLIQKKTAEV
jgi:hypothetical protein